MHNLRLIASMVLLGLCPQPMMLAAQGFEGTIRHRTISIEREMIDRLLFGDEDADEGQYDPEEDPDAESRRLAIRLFEIPIDRLLGAARAGDGQVEETTTWIKGNRMRADLAASEGMAGYTILDLDAGTITMVDTRERYFVRWTQADLEAALRDMGLPEDEPEEEFAPENLMVRDLGKRMDVNGQPCRGFEVEVPDGDLVWGWVSETHGALRDLMSGIGQRVTQMVGDDTGPDVEGLLLERGFPMRVQRLYGGVMGGFSTYEVEDVIAIERTTVAADRFVVPAGFAEKSLKDLWEQAGNEENWR